MPVMNCLKQDVASGGQHYPLFVGFLPSSEILQIAEVPSFSASTPHHEISRNILTPPVKDWQRPLDTTRLANIAAVYSDTGQIMPNPVLLCENVTLTASPITVRQQQAAGAILTNIWEVNIPQPGQGVSKPLWILDGQHRINGLAQSQQRANPIPVVLLLNQGLNVYSGPLVAKIFAQVTTSAKKLDDLHNEWLTFAFGLDSYAQTFPNSVDNSKSMQATARLCLNPLIANQATNNVFFNQVQFNAHLGVGPLPGGFSYNCIEFKEIIRRYYYSCASTAGPHLQPNDLADQLSLAHTALTRVVQAPLDQTVFFGDAKHEQKIVQDAYLIGVLSHLLQQGIPADWAIVLQQLNFQTTNWNFKNWTKSLSGPAQTISRSLAIKVFASAFRNLALPVGAGNFADFLRGNNASVTLRFSQLTPAGRTSRVGAKEVVLTLGSRKSETVTPAKHLRVVTQSKNIGAIEVSDKQSPPGRIVFYNEMLKRGLLLDPAKHNNPLQLYFRMIHYGGTESTAEIDISW